MNETRKLPFLCMAVLSLGWLTGCLSSYKYIEVQNDYIKSSLPTHFNRSVKNSGALSIGCRVASTETFEFYKPFQINVDSSGRSFDNPPPGWTYNTVTVDGLHMLTNSSATIDLDYLQEFGWAHIGVSGRLGGKNLHSYGLFGGLGKKINNIVPSYSVGFYRTWIDATLRYWRHDPSHTELQGGWSRGSERGFYPQLDVTHKFGLLYDRDQLTSPYAAYSGNRIFLAAPGSSLSMDIHEFSLGLLRPLSPRYSVYAELSYTRSLIEGHSKNSFRNVSTRIAREF